jgi:triosephosphate isomerase
MYKTRDEALSFIYEVAKAIPDRNLVETVICAPSIMLRDLVKREDEHLRIGAQNMSQHEEGAYTGEISARMLTSYGVEYVVIGHSERREFFHEHDAIINAKTKQALQHHLTPIVCVGESLETRELNQTNDFVKKQILNAYEGFSTEEALKTIIAYEPVWAIGTGRTASAEQAQEVHAHIRKVLADQYGKEIADTIPILYGGSCNPTNAKALFSMPDIDGGLIGGASLKADDFYAIIQSI